jgi:hypothetical protein
MVHASVVRLVDHTGVDANGVAQGGGCPQIQIHYAYRDIFGTGISVRVYGEMKIAAGERVWARELELKTLQVLVLTPEINRRLAHGYIPEKYINHKGEFDNYASIDVFDDAATWQGRGTGPIDGSIWLDFIAEGE